MNHTMKAADEKMSTAIEHFRQEIKGLRTGRANPAMVEGLKVSVYGAQMRLIDIASISVPEPRQLLITPYDPQNSAAIGKAILEANLGVQPVVEANCVRINVPPMDESLRKDMIKVCHQKLEECKGSIRNIRRECNEAIRQRKTDKEISDDEARGLEKKIQEKTDEFCKKADSVAKQKEMEIFTI